MLAPACNKPRSRVRRTTSLSAGGTSPAAIRKANPSTTAVLPTPASPVRIGLFCRRRIRISTICRISPSRPRIGSISPFLAFSVRSTENRPSASCLPIGAGAIAPLVSPGETPAAPAWSAAPSDSSGEPCGHFREIIGQRLKFYRAKALSTDSERHCATWSLEQCDYHVTSPDTVLSEKERSKYPTAFDRFLKVRRKIGDRGRARGAVCRVQWSDPWPAGRCSTRKCLMIRCRSESAS